MFECKSKRRYRGNDGGGYWLWRSIKNEGVKSGKSDRQTAYLTSLPIGQQRYGCYFRIVDFRDRLMNQALPSTSPEPSGKEPWLAVCLSSLFPGIGQIYSGQRFRGIFWILSFIIFSGLGLFSLLTQTGNILLGVGSLLLLPIVKILNLFDAHTCTQKSNPSEFEELRKQSKDPWKAVFISTILLGAGHFYLGNGLLGSILLFFVVASYFIPKLAILIWLLSPLVIYHVYITTPTQREKSKRFLIPIALLITIGSGLISGLVQGSIREFVAESRYIPTGAMIPSLTIHDRLVINKLNYQYQDPQRGDIIVFNPPEALQKEGFKTAFIKRIIGLPGETIEILEDRVYINGNPLDEPYLDESSKTRVDICRNRNSYFSRQEGEEQNIWEATVPPNSYLVMGDNRENSYDSRCWGTVPREYIVGKATKIFWPLNRIGNLN